MNISQRGLTVPVYIGGPEISIKETTKAVDHEDGRQVVPEPAGRGLSEDYTTKQKYRIYKTNIVGEDFTLSVFLF